MGFSCDLDAVSLNELNEHLKPVKPFALVTSRHLVPSIESLTL